MKVIQTEQEYDQIVQQGLVVAKFSADWCKDCKYIDPFMPELEEKYKDQMTLIHVDRDTLIEVCEKNNVFGIPSFIAYKNGQEIARFVSKLQKTKEEIDQFLNRAVQIAQSI
jgi:thioredoxin-like negative regulator of GroEL